MNRTVHCYNNATLYENKCICSEPVLVDQLLGPMFGDSGFQMTCSVGECIHQSEVMVGDIVFLGFFELAGALWT